MTVLLLPPPLAAATIFCCLLLSVSRRSHNIDRIKVDFPSRAGKKQRDMRSARADTRYASIVLIDDDDDAGVVMQSEGEGADRCQWSVGILHDEQLVIVSEDGGGRRTTSIISRSSNSCWRVSALVTADRVCN